MYMPSWPPSLDRGHLNYLWETISVPSGKGGFWKIGLFTDIYSQELFAFKSKAAAGRNTVDSLWHISQMFTAPETFMADGGGHFNRAEVKDYCESIGTKLHVEAAYSPWINPSENQHEADRDRSWPSMNPNIPLKVSFPLMGNWVQCWHIEAHNKSRYK